jgi:diacylglycerol kinase family enzyme
MLIVFNPVAGRRRAQLLWRVLDVMSANGVRLEIAETQHRGRATELAREAAATGANWWWPPAAMAPSLPGRLKRALGRNAYVLQTLREAARYTFPPISLRIDGAETTTGSVVVTKGRFYAGRYELAPGASPTDCGLTLALFDYTGTLPALLYSAALPLGLLPRMPGLRLLRGSRVEISGANLWVQSDGDPAGAGPLTVTDAPAAIDVVVG